MKTFERQKSGYSEETLDDFLEVSLFPSSFFDQPVPVRGICFAAGQESLPLARAFVSNRIGHGTITLRMEKMTSEAWSETARLFTRPTAEVTNVDFILHDLDLTSPALQVQVAATISATDTVRWFATAGDHRRLSAALKLPLLVYLGLSPAGKMRFLAQNGQQLLIDAGSLRKAPRRDN